MLLEFGKGLIIVVVAQLLFLSLFLFTQKTHHKLSNRLLAVFFLLMAINFSDLLLKLMDLDGHYQKVALLDDAFILAFGPIIWQYTQSLISGIHRFPRKWIWHYLPFMLVTLLRSGASVAFMVNVEAPESAFSIDSHSISPH